MDSFLTVNECATILKVNPMTVYRQCKRGAIKYRREGRAIRVYASQLLPPVTKDEENEKIKQFVFA